MYFIANPTTLSKKGFFDEASGFKSKTCIDKQLIMTHKNTKIKYMKRLNQQCIAKTYYGNKN